MPFGRKARVGFQQTLKLQHRLVIQGDVLQALKRNAAPLEAEAYGMTRKRSVVLLGAEALFLAAATISPSCSRQAVVAAMVKRGDPEECPSPCENSGLL